MYTTTQKMQIARSSIYNYLSCWSDDVDRDRIEDCLLDDDDFCTEIQRAETEDEINEIVEVYTDNLIEDRGIAEFSNRDPWYNWH